MKTMKIQVEVQNFEPLPTDNNMPAGAGMNGMAIHAIRPYGLMVCSIPS
jgi:hypothetical protein